MAAWFDALFSDPGNLRDLAGFIRGASPRVTLDAAERLRTFPRPALMPWAVEDRFFPYSDAEQLAEILQPARLAGLEPAPETGPIPHIESERGEV